MQTITLSQGELDLNAPSDDHRAGANLLTLARSTAMGTPQFRIFRVDTGVTAALSGLTITGGDATGDNGGGIYNFGGTLDLTNVTVRGNTATAGGGIFTYGGTLTLTGSTVSGNTATDGGGLYNLINGTLILTDSTVSGNTATNTGGGIRINGGPTTTTLTNATVSGNSAPSGGGIYNGGRTLNVTRTIIAGNAGSDLSGSSINGTNANNLTTGNPLLAPLGNYGGSTQTQPPLPGSPAIDTGGVGCSGTDQRGVTRPLGSACNIGAVESQGFASGTLTGNNQSAPVNTAFGSAVGLTVSSANNEPVQGGQITFTITPGGGTSAAFGTAPMGCTNMSRTVSVCTVGMAGVVTSPTFTANGTVGSFTIVATANGMTTATFNETNTGIAPMAVNDAYTTVANATLTVPAATGVLANDTLGTPAATITTSTQPTHGSVMLNTSDGSFVYTPTSGYVGTDSFTYTLSNGIGTFGTGSSTGTVSLTVTAAAVTGLTTTAPTGSGNSGSATNPTLNLGGRVTLTTTATFNNNTSGAVSGLMYTSSNPGVATVDASGTVVALTAGTTTITVTGPNNSRTMITLTVTGAAGAGLMPNPQPMAHGSAATAVATPLPQPGRH